MVATVAEEDVAAARQTLAMETRARSQVLVSVLSLRERLQVLKRFRHVLAGQTEALTAAISPELARNPADTLAAEVLPLLAACEFLERNAASVLKTRHPGRRGLPFWLAGVQSAVERVPLGRVLVIGPANYPLFLPGVQTLQAIAAGNTVIWKPGRGGAAVARIFASAMQRAGLPDGVLEVTDESVEAATRAMAAGVDKVFFTGSAAAGRSVLHAAAETATPVVAELSGCDAVYVLPGADLERMGAALAFGMRLNGSATCMAPRRLMLIGRTAAGLIAMLRDGFSKAEPVALPSATAWQLRDLTAEAESSGALVHGDANATPLRPILIENARPEMRVMQSDLFAPVLAAAQFDTLDEALAADRLCPYGLTAAVFGPEREALAFAAQLKVGTVLINDLIVPTADPRVPFGGRRGSGFGVTRGAEGLLEMTAPRTMLVRRGRSQRHLSATGPMHGEMFTGVVEMQHAPGWRKRFAGLRRMIKAAKDLK